MRRTRHNRTRYCKAGNGRGGAFENLRLATPTRLSGERVRCITSKLRLPAIARTDSYALREAIQRPIDWTVAKATMIGIRQNNMRLGLPNKLKAK
jgi:hypothetical protein